MYVQLHWRLPITRRLFNNLMAIGFSPFMRTLTCISGPARKKNVPTEVTRNKLFCDMKLLSSAISLILTLIVSIWYKGRLSKSIRASRVYKCQWYNCEDKLLVVREGYIYINHVYTSSHTSKKRIIPQKV